MVLGLLVLEVLLAVALVLLGVASTVLLASFGSAVAMTIIAPTLEEVGRRKPVLSLAAEETGGDGVVVASMSPWPIDIDRIAANEIAEARETLALSTRLNFVSMFSDPLAIPPSDADHARAREAFEEQVSAYEADLRQWLAEYVTAAAAHAGIFRLTLRLKNGTRGANAEAVTVVVELPETVRIVDERPQLSALPERPHYQPPRPKRSAIGPNWLRSEPLVSARRQPIDLSFLARDVQRKDPAWKVSESGRYFETSAGEVHSGRSVHVGEPLLLLTDGPGRHEVRWTVYAHNARRAARGSFTLLVPPSRNRPAFGRLHGLMSYPDVPLVDDDGEILHDVRTDDPPLAPPSYDGDSDDLTSLLRQTASFNDWSALGLDPATDGAPRFEVRRAIRRPVET
jgi:hypothetical protein